MIQTHVQSLALVAEPGNRSVVIPHASGRWETVFRGVDTEEPDLVCGNCHSTLVTGLARSQFVSKNLAPPEHSVVQLPAGACWIKKSIFVPPGFLVASAAGRPIIQCPSCWSLNEVKIVKAGAAGRA